MKTFYSVTTTVYDSGRVVVAVTDSVQAETIPENRCSEKSDRDIYTDWFESMDAAQAFVKEAKEA